MIPHHRSTMFCPHGSAAFRTFGLRILLPLAVSCGAHLHAALPDAAQEPFKKAMSAAQQKDFPLAIRYFNEARTAAPGASDVLFNLGLAEAQVPGRELRAGCWFESYLALAPAAANAAAVRQQISDLEIRAEGNVRKIIDVMKNLAGQFPAGDYSGVSATKQIARMLAKSGDLDGAIATAESLPVNERDNARGDVVDVLADMGRLDDARKLANSISYADDKKDIRSRAFKSIAGKQIEQGLYADARQSINNISTLYLLESLATAFFKAGRKEDATAVLEKLTGLVGNKSQYDLIILVTAQVNLGRHDEAMATLKKLDSLLPTKASSNNNNSIHSALKAHLEASDIPGAKALLPRIIDDHNRIFNYKVEAAKSIENEVVRNKEALINQHLEQILQLTKSRDISGMESLLALPSMIPVVRIRGYAKLADLYKQESSLDKLPGIFKKARADFDTVGQISKPSAANWIARIAAAAGLPADARTWRLKALQSIDPLIKNGTQYIPGNSNALYGYYKYNDLAGGTISAALSSGDEKSVQAGIEAFRKHLPKLDADTQSKLAGSVLRYFWWTARNFDAAAAFIKTIPDAKYRQQALDKHCELQFRKLLATENLTGAGKMLGQISDAPAGYAPVDKSDKSGLQNELAEALADAGEWDNAEKIAAGIKADSYYRKSAMDHLATSRAAGQFTAPQPTEKDAAKRRETNIRTWNEKRTTLASLTEPTERLAAYGNLCGYPQEGVEDEQRKLMPDYLATALAIAKPDVRLDKLHDTAMTAQRQGLFEMERHARAAAFSAFPCGSGLSYIAEWFLSQASPADYLEQASVRWQDPLLLKAIDRMVADGNPAAAAKIVAKLTKTGESKRNWILMNLWIAQGKLSDARAAYDKIGKDDYNKNANAKSKATLDMVRACIKTGDLASAKSLFEESKKLRNDNWDDASMIKEIGLAGELEWALEKSRQISDVTYRHRADIAIIGTLAARNQDAAAAKALLKTLLEDDASSSQHELIDAVIAGGNPQLALQLIPELVDYKYQASRTVAAVQAMARSGDVAAAKKAVGQIGNNASRFSVRCDIAREQVRMGDLDEARATLAEARKLDPRTAKDLDMDAWIKQQIFLGYDNKEDFVAAQGIKALADKGDFAGAQAAALQIQNPDRCDSELCGIAYAAAKKQDFAAVMSALAKIRNPATRSRMAASAAAEANEPAPILALLEHLNDPGLQTIALGRALNKAISQGDVSAVMPRVLALPDGAVKAYLLCDVLRAKAFLAIDAGNATLLPLTLMALAAMPPDVWHAVLLRDLARLLQQIDPGQAQILQSHADAAAQGLSGTDATLWQQFLADTEITKTEVQKQVLADAETAKKEAQKAAGTPQDKSAEDLAKAWADYLEYNLKKPLFMDFKLALDGAASSTADNSGNKAWSLFNNVQQLAQDLIDKLKEIRKLRADQSKKTAKS